MLMIGPLFVVGVLRKKSIFAVNGGALLPALPANTPTWVTVMGSANAAAAVQCKPSYEYPTDHCSGVRLSRRMIDGREWISALKRVTCSAPAT